MNCFRSIQAVTAPPFASSSDHSDHSDRVDDDRFDDEHTFLAKMMPSFDRFFSATDIEECLRQRSELGDEEYAVFLLEDFNLRSIFFKTVVIPRMVGHLVLLSAGQRFYLFKLIAPFQISLTVSHTNVTLPLLTFLLLRRRKPQSIEVIWMCSWLVYTLELLDYWRSWQAAIVDVLPMCFVICSILHILIMRLIWTEQRGRVSLI